MANDPELLDGRNRWLALRRRAAFSNDYHREEDITDWICVPVELVRSLREDLARWIVDRVSAAQKALPAPVPKPSSKRGRPPRKKQVGYIKDEIVQLDEAGRSKKQIAAELSIEQNYVRAVLSANRRRKEAASKPPQ